MERKTAIIIGVIILVLTSIVTPFILKKINDKANNISKGTQIEEVNKQADSSISIEKLDSSGEKDSKEEVQMGSGDENEEQKSVETDEKQEVTKQENINSTIENKTTSSQGARNQATQSKEEKNNVLTNVVEEVIEEKVKNIEIIDVVASEEDSQEIQTQLEQQEIIEEVEETNIILPEGAVGILKIDKLGINQKVADGHSLDVLKNNLGHVDSTAYSTGNVGILGHNSGNAGYFKNLWDLKKDDVIEYTTLNGTKIYKVSDVIQISDDDWSKFANTKDNRITLITCVKGVPEKRWCIQGIEI